MTKLRAWLKANRLTADPSDYTAVPDLNGTYNVRSIVDALQMEGMEIQAETAVDIITRFNRKAAEFVTGGYSVNTGLVVMQPRIRGKFTESETYTPGKHRVYISVQQGVELRKATQQATVELQGVLQSGISVRYVKDVSTDKTDGTVTRGKNVIIGGYYLKLAGDDPSVGVTLTNKATSTATRLADKDIVRNTPSELLVLIPDSLPAGKYELSVTSQYASGSKFLKTPRTATYKGEITIA